MIGKIKYDAERNCGESAEGGKPFVQVKGSNHPVQMTIFLETPAVTACENQRFSSYNGFSEVL